MSPGRSPNKDDGKGRDPARAGNIDRTTSGHAPTSSSPAIPRPQWSTKSSTPRRGTGEPEESPGMDELTDESSDDSEDDSDELEETGDDATERRALSSSVVAEPLDVSGKELTYVLEVIQQPQRARACGFGDKDRRPLSPPPIVQLKIFDQQGNAISPLAVDYHRFIIMVDLWNGDQSQQRSIVMHPGARQDQYALFTHAASRASSSSHAYDAPQPTLSRMPLRPAPPSGWHGAEWPMYAGRPSHFTHSSSHSYGHPPSSQYSGPMTPVSAPGWSPPRHEPVPRGHHPGASPARASYGLPPHEGWYEPGSSRHPQMSPGDAAYHHPGTRAVSSSARDPHPWGPESSQHPGDYGEHGAYASSSSYRPATSSAADSGWSGHQPFMGGRDRPHTAGHDDREYQRPWSSGESQRPRSSHGPLFTHVPAVSPISSHGSLPPIGASPNMTPAPFYPESYAERLSSTSHYSRVLVGSMGAVCQRLKGLDDQPGLFFFAHDLGIRTEGTFSLRFTLVDISSLCVPGVVQDQSTHMLARIYSKPFTVFSAKRFPGVLPTTDLTQCFADQSVRLPTRQKRSSNNHGSSGPRRKK